MARATRAGATAIALALSLAAAPIAVAQDVRPADEDALRFLQRERERAGVPPLERRGELDTAARERARELAARLPASTDPAAGPSAARGRPPVGAVATPERGEPLERLLERAGARRWRMAVEHLDVRRTTTSGEAFARLWRTRPEAWMHVLDRHVDAVGIALLTVPDGRQVFVAVLVDDAPAPADLRALEGHILERVNRARAEHGRAALAPDTRLADLARAHSADMAAREVLDPRSARGASAAERLRAAGVPFTAVAQTVARNRHATDPAAAAVTAWMGSVSARERLLQAFTHAGAGAAVDAEGRIYFTLLLVHPTRGSADAGPHPPNPDDVSGDREVVPWTRSTCARSCPPSPTSGRPGSSAS